MTAILSDKETGILTSYWRHKANEAFSHAHIMPIKTYMTISLLLGAGLRINELANLKIENVHVSEKPYYLLVHIREIAIPKKLANDLKYYIQWLKLKYPKTEYLIPNRNGKRMTKQNVAQTWRNAMSKSGLKPIKTYAARHTFATRFLEKHKNLRALQSQLGHANIVSTSRYLHVTMGQIANMIEND